MKNTVWILVSSVLVVPTSAHAQSFASALTEAETQASEPPRTALLSSSFPATTFIDFRELVNNGTLPIPTVVSDQFAAQGVVLSLAAVTEPRYPGPISDTFGPSETAGLFNTFNYDTPIIADFTVPVRRVTFTSIPDSPLTVQALDDQGGLLLEASIMGGTEVGEIVTSDDIVKRRAH